MVTNPEGIEQLIQITAQKAMETAAWVTRGTTLPRSLNNEETERVKQEHAGAVSGLARPLIDTLLDQKVIELLSLKRFMGGSPDILIPDIYIDRRHPSNNMVTIASGLLFYLSNARRHSHSSEHLAEANFRWSFPLKHPSEVTFNIQALGRYDNQDEPSLQQKEDEEKFRGKVNTTFPGEKDWDFSISGSEGGMRERFCYRTYIANRAFEPVDLAAGERFLRLFLVGTKGLFEVTNQRIAQMTLSKAEAQRLTVLTTACIQATDIIHSVFPRSSGLDPERGG